MTHEIVSKTIRLTLFPQLLAWVMIFAVSSPQVSAQGGEMSFRDMVNFEDEEMISGTVEEEDERHSAPEEPTLSAPMIILPGPVSDTDDDLARLFAMVDETGETGIEVDEGSGEKNPSDSE